MYICIDAVQGAEYTLFSWGTLAVGRFREAIAINVELPSLVYRVICFTTPDSKTLGRY